MHPHHPRYEELLETDNQTNSTKNKDTSPKPTAMQRVGRLLRPAAFIALGIAASAITSKRR